MFKYFLYCVNFRLQTSPFTAGSGDYSDKPIEITFQPGETGPKSIDIDIIDDNILEDTERFTAFLRPSTPGVKAGQPATVEILDNEGDSKLFCLFSWLARNPVAGLSVSATENELT